MARGLSRRIMRWHPTLWLALAGLLLVPLIAMQFTREVAWTGSDFLAAALLLGGAALVFELALNFIAGRGARIAVIACAVAVTLAIWAQGAVGVV